MITFALYDSKDIQLAKIIYKLSPQRVKILALDFYKKDQYKYKYKRKYLKKEFSNEQIVDLQNYFSKNDFYHVKSYIAYKWIMLRTKVHLTRGLDLYVIKPSKRIKYRIICINRIFYTRLNLCLPYFFKKKINFKIMFSGRNWLNPQMVNNWELMDGIDDSLLIQNMDKVNYVDILGCTREILDDIGINNIKEEFGIPKNKKIALFSFRKAGNGFSFFKSDSEYMDSVRSNLELLKTNGYFIICRRRVDPKDIDFYKVKKSPNIDTSKIKHLIDLEINHNEGFPSAIYKLLYISELLYLSDQSGIASVEAALMKCPVYCPFPGSKKNIVNNTDYISPPIKDMINKNLIFNKISTENIKGYKDTIDIFLDNWFETNKERFWKELYS